jgi:hypothetical protein
VKDKHKEQEREMRKRGLLTTKTKKVREKFGR